MNSNFHAVSISFNWYMIVAVALVVMVAIIGRFQYRLVRTPRGWRIAKRFGDEVYLGIGFQCGMVMAVLLVIESHMGIIQFLNNRLSPGDSPLLSVFLMPFVAVAAGGIYGFLVAVIGDFVSTRRKKQFVRELRLVAMMHYKGRSRRK